MLFVKKGKGQNRIFNNARSLPPDQHTLNMKRLHASFVGFSMPSCMQPVYQSLNPLDYGCQLLDGVHVPVWYNTRSFYEKTIFLPEPQFSQLSVRN